MSLPWKPLQICTARAVKSRFQGNSMSSTRPQSPVSCVCLSPKSFALLRATWAHVISIPTQFLEECADFKLSMVSSFAPKAHGTSCRKGAVASCSFSTPPPLLALCVRHVICFSCRDCFQICFTCSPCGSADHDDACGVSC